MDRALERRNYQTKLSPYAEVSKQHFNTLLNQAFFWTFGKKLKAEGKYSKLKPKAQIVRIF